MQRRREIRFRRSRDRRARRVVDGVRIQRRTGDRHADGRGGRSRLDVADRDGSEAGSGCERRRRAVQRHDTRARCIDVGHSGRQTRLRWQTQVGRQRQRERHAGRRARTVVREHHGAGHGLTGVDVGRKAQAHGDVRDRGTGDRRRGSVVRGIGIRSQRRDGGAHGRVARRRLRIRDRDRAQGRSSGERGRHAGQSHHAVARRVNIAGAGRQAAQSRRCGEIRGQRHAVTKSGRGTRTGVRVRDRAADRQACIDARREMQDRREIRLGRAADRRRCAVVARIRIVGRLRDRGRNARGRCTGLHIAHADGSDRGARGERRRHARERDDARARGVRIGGANRQAGERRCDAEIRGQRQRIGHVARRAGPIVRVEHGARYIKACVHGRREAQARREVCFGRAADRRARRIVEAVRVGGRGRDPGCDAGRCDARLCIADRDHTGARTGRQHGRHAVQGDDAVVCGVAVGGTVRKTRERRSSREIRGQRQRVGDAACRARADVRIEHGARYAKSCVDGRREAQARREIRLRGAADRRARRIVETVRVGGRGRDAGRHRGRRGAGLQVPERQRPQSRAGSERRGHREQAHDTRAGCIAIARAGRQSRDRRRDGQIRGQCQRKGDAARHARAVVRVEHGTRHAKTRVDAHRQTQAGREIRLRGAADRRARTVVTAIRIVGGRRDRSRHSRSCGARLHIARADRPHGRARRERRGQARQGHDAGVRGVGVARAGTQAAQSRRDAEICGQGQRIRDAARQARTVVRVEHGARDRCARVHGCRKAQGRREIRFGRAADRDSRDVVRGVRIVGRRRDAGRDRRGRGSGLDVAHRDRAHGGARGQGRCQTRERHDPGAGCVAIGGTRRQAAQSGRRREIRGQRQRVNDAVRRARPIVRV